MADDFTALQERYRNFVDERDWRQFHDPRSLVLALVGEVGELAELFQWVPDEQAADMFRQGDRQQRAGEEMSDVLIYLLGLADSLQVDLLAAAHAKLTAAEGRFPADEVKGQALLKP
ncbi:nucleotide pyrophosphohydrolase [Luteococcus sp. H138]|uniref:nucleotide pyrophosphohydrolase n=1 Tax=unclassified Luteococcus TaxID=2639923 RepID=UPI00313CE3EE